MVNYLQLIRWVSVGIYDMSVPRYSDFLSPTSHQRAFIRIWRKGRRYYES